MRNSFQITILDRASGGFCFFRFCTELCTLHFYFLLLFLENIACLGKRENEFY